MHLQSDDLSYVVAVPSTLRASLGDVPVLAWTAAHAYTVLPATRRADVGGSSLRLATAVWLVPVWLVLWLPVITACVVAATAARIDRHALVAVRPAGRSLKVRGAVVMAAVGMASGSLLIGPAVLLLPGWATTALMLPLALDLIGVAMRARRTGRGTGPHSDGRAQAGEEVWIIELYAAHPTGQGHGGRLVDELVEHLPADVWLMTAAASASLAEHYQARYGFRSWD